MKPIHHECWWSRKKMCEVEFDAADSRLSGAGISLPVLEAGCTFASGRLEFERADEENMSLSAILPESSRVSGSIHDDCFFTFERAPDALVKGVCRALLEQQAGYAAAQVSLGSSPTSLAHALREFGCLRLRTEPKHTQITIERLTGDSPLFGRRFRRIGRVRLDQPEAKVEIPNQRMHRTRR
jgi:hypothetical protein